MVDKAIGIFLVASIFPSAISTLNDANTDGWSTTTVTLWGLTAILCVVAVIKWLLT